MSDRQQAGAAATPPADMAAALATMATHMVERQIELMRTLMTCTDPAALTTAATKWTEASFTGLIADQARVMEAAAAQAAQFVSGPR